MLTSDPCSVLGEVFVVQWDKVRLQGREAEGTFTFQAALHNNGTIAFNYREVSFLIQCTIIGLFFLLLNGCSTSYILTNPMICFAIIIVGVRYLSQ